MSGMGPTYEAIAHFVHGGVTVFFLTWSWLLWPMRRQSNMMYMLFLNMAYFAFCNLKDLIFLVDGYWEDMFYSGISVTIDLLYVPIMANFFIEVVSPGWVTRRRVLVPVCIQALFVPAFILYPNEAVYNVALYVAYGGGVVAMAFACFLAAHHWKYIRDNYSYTEHIDVSWAIRCGILLFICLTLYILAFANETWLSGAVFQIICVCTWLYLYSLSRKHLVVDVPSPVFAFPWVSRPMSEKQTIVSEDIYAGIASRLETSITRDKIYLNPKLSLQDVASEIGTNRTYLSDYLNTALNQTFYEFVNFHRVNEACRIIDAIRGEARVNMSEIAEKSGFNSISTFNRAFSKQVGMTPTMYLRRHP